MLRVSVKLEPPEVERDVVLRVDVETAKTLLALCRAAGGQSQYREHTTAVGDALLRVVGPDVTRLRRGPEFLP